VWSYLCLLVAYLCSEAQFKQYIGPLKFWFVIYVLQFLTSDRTCPSEWDTFRNWHSFGGNYKLGKM
jgi:hypothetical protein